MADAHIFVYHRFDDSRYPSTNISESKLIKDFEYLKNNGYKVIPLKKLIKALKEKREIKDNWVVLTIDDGYKSFYDNGLKIFKKYNYPFTLFISTKPTQKEYRDFMSWEDIKETLKYGEIGFHSHSHPHLVKLSSKEIEEDTKKGIEIFQKELGFRPKYYAYPYGEYDNKVKEIIKSFGFDAILNQNIGAVNKYSDIYDLNRIAVVNGVNITSKLRLKYLNAIWIEPKNYPKDSMLKKIKVKIFEDVKKAQIYITGFGWRWVDVKSGIIEENLNIRLNKSRVRVIVKIKNSKINSKILVKKE